MTSRQDNSSTAHVVMLAAVAILMQQVAGKAARDAMFLANFAVSALPAMIMISSALSVGAGLLFSRSLAKVSPMRLLPGAFVGSTALLLLTWSLTGLHPKFAAVLLYLQMGTFSPVLISGFWSLLNERFDPHAAKHTFTRVGVGASVGGLVGGMVAGWIATQFGLFTMLPFLAVLNLIAGVLLFPLRKGFRGEPPRDTAETQTAGGVQTVLHVSHLRNLGLVVLAGTVSAALLDYVFKAQASTAFSDGSQLLRFFGVFYTLAGVLTLAIQILLTRPSIDRLGLSGMVASLPTTVLAGSICSLFVPGLASAALARVGESVLRSSLFRSSYELFYTPIPRDQKRAAKPIIDVSIERLGDAIGAVMIQLLLVATTHGALTSMLLMSLAIATTTLVVAHRLPSGYREALESTLLNAPSEMLSAPATGTLSITLRDADNVVLFHNHTEMLSLRDSSRRRMLQLASDDPDVLRRALARMKPLDRLAVPRVIELLGRDDVAAPAAESLRNIATSITGQLLDVLTDSDQPSVIRARVAAVLAASGSQRAVDGLIDALHDQEFEIRFQAGLSLEENKDRSPQIHIDSERVMEAVNAELHLYASRETIRLEHVFRLLSLVLPKDPLRVAYRVLLSDDAYLNGTAMEYLETVLPPQVWQRIRRLVESDTFSVGVA